MCRVCGSLKGCDGGFKADKCPNFEREITLLPYKRDILRELSLKDVITNEDIARFEEKIRNYKNQASKSQ